MQNDPQMSRRGFISRLSMTAGGILVAGSAADLLAGCGGGGLNGATIGTTLPAIPAIVPKTPSQALTGFAGKTGLPIGFSSVTPTGTVTSANLSSSVAALTTPTQLVFINGVLTTVGQSSLTPAQLQAFQNALVASGLIQPGDQTATITVNIPNGFSQAHDSGNVSPGSHQVQAFLNPSGDVIYCPFLDATPLSFVTNNAKSGLTYQQQIVGTNPATGYVIAFTLTFSATQNGASITPGTVSLVFTQAHPFVHATITQPTVTAQSGGCYSATGSIALSYNPYGTAAATQAWATTLTFTATLCPPTGS